MTINVHNHGPNEGRGVDCGEPRLADGSFIGWCQILPVIRKAQEQAWEEGITASGINLDWQLHLLDHNPYTEES